MPLAHHAGAVRGLLSPSWQARPSRYKSTVFKRQISAGFARRLLNLSRRAHVRAARGEKSMGRVIADATEAAAELGRAVDEAKSVVFFGGAGVSTASGIPDFRSEDGSVPSALQVPARGDALPRLLRHAYRRVLRLLPHAHDCPWRQAQPGPPQAGRAGACRQAYRGHHAEHRRPPPGRELKERPRAPWLRASQCLPALRPRLLCRVDRWVRRACRAARSAAEPSSRMWFCTGRAWTSACFSPP